jgi:hypothetical protein
MPTDPKLVQEINRLLDGNIADKARIAEIETGSGRARSSALVRELTAKRNAVKERNRRIQTLKSQ